MHTLRASGAIAAEASSAAITLHRKSLPRYNDPAMATLKFIFSPGGSYETYEVYNGRMPLGLVWKVGEVWHADPHNMTDPGIGEATRDAAAEKLLLATRGAR